MQGQLKFGKVLKNGGEKVKILLCGCFLIAAVTCGWLLTCKYRRRKEFFCDLHEFNERLLNEVSYTKVPLSAFMEKYEFGADLRAMLEKYRLGNENGSPPPYLKADEVRFLIGYFSMIGKSDAASQKTYLSSVSAELGERRKVAQEACVKYTSLYLKLGLLAGLTLCILIA